MFNQPDANPEWEGRSTVYGPVNSWRVGLSLGIDLLFVNSICSFRCVYCQLGKINIHTSERQIFVPTATVLRDLQASEWSTADIITFSGNGEPTLAANIGEVMRETKRLTRKPLLVLTNSAHLDQPEVRRDIKTADKIFCKLDAVDEETFRWMNRPCSGITLAGIVNGISALRREYDGFLAIQTMFTRINRHRMAGFSDVIKRIGPDEVQLNLPSRPVPKRWAVDYRGGADSAGARLLKAPSKEEVLELQDELEKTTRIRVVSRYRQ